MERRLGHTITDLIGNTPLLRVRGDSDSNDVTILVKCEWLNPGGSIKDRTALAMIDDAERRGQLTPGGTIVEATSGNTGVGLAMLAAERGYRCELVCTDKVSTEKIALMKAHGATVHICPNAVDPTDARSYYRVAERLETELGAWRANQYNNPANVLAHETTTGPEIWRDTKGQVTHVFAGAGTGGTITGIARALHRHNSAIQCVAVDAEGSVYSGGDGRPYLVEGIGEDFWPATYDPNEVDSVHVVTDAEAFAMARSFASSHGLPLGGSGAAVLVAANKVAAAAPKGSVLVAVVPDSGRGYLSRIYNDDWLTHNGFTTQPHAPRPERQVFTVRGEVSVAQARALMRRTGIGVLPVVGHDGPVVYADVQGTVTAAKLYSVDGSLPVGSVADKPLPAVGEFEGEETLAAALKTGPGALVLRDGRILEVITQLDTVSV